MALAPDYTDARTGPGQKDALAGLALSRVAVMSGDGGEPGNDRKAAARVHPSYPRFPPQLQPVCAEAGELACALAFVIRLG